MYHPLLVRYASIVDSLADRWRCLEQPLPVCLWMNPLKTSSTELELWLESQGFQWETVGWSMGGYRVWGWDKPGRSLPFVCGWYGVQEEIAHTAVTVLTPQPGDRVLDLCAAPGGKTAQLSLAVGDTGMVIANERSLSRLSALWCTVTRWGLTNVLTSHSDGRQFAAPPHSFDRVLVDAPCSGEGTVRKKIKPDLIRTQQQIEKLTQCQPEHRHRLMTIQQQLLDRALSLVKPGGIVVYSTCTFAPEENEAVVDAVVGDRGVIEAFDIPGLQRAPGVTHWQGQSFRSDSIHAHRYWPHLNDTGGFFIARIRRTDIALTADQSSNYQPNHQPNHQQSYHPIRPSYLVQSVWEREAIAWFQHRFGLASHLFEPYALWSTGKEKKWLASSNCMPLTNVSLNTIGLPLVRRTPHGFKPTTAALQRFGLHITEQVVNLDVDQCHQFMRGEPIAYPLPDGLSPGFVHVRSGGYELGCGRWKQGQLHCELPKFLRSQL